MPASSTPRAFPIRPLLALLGVIVSGCDAGPFDVDTGYAGSEEAGTAPAAPTDLVITLLGPDSVRLAWRDNASDEEGFRVYRASSREGSALIASLGENATSVQDTGLAPGTTYDYRVVAFNASGESSAATATITMPTDGDQCVPPDPAKRVLVDASKDGGVWWFPQGNTFDQGAPHQGKALADYLRCRGYVVTELGRGTRMTDSLARAFDIIIRANRFAPAYTSAEVEAYREFLGRSTTLVLLSDHQTNTDGRDEVAGLVGIGFAGRSADEEVTRFADHPITQGVTALRYRVGAYAVAREASVVQFLGWLADGNPIMGISTATTAKVFFLGDTNLLEALPQPLLDNLIEWGF